MARPGGEPSEAFLLVGTYDTAEAVTFQSAGAEARILEGGLRHECRALIARLLCKSFKVPG